MRYKLKVLLLFLIPFSMVSQELVGKIYDEESTVKGATIYNISKAIIRHTNDKGDFKIEASVNDTIIFYSLFHKQQTLKLNKAHFSNTLVIELKKAVNDLDEVMITNNPKEKVFIAKQYKDNFGLQIENDMKERPYLYKPPPSGNLDFVKIASLIGKLFKSKKTKPTPIITMTYKELDSLFSNNSFFTNKLLTNELKIPKEYKSLFFDYCDAKGINQNLLLKDNQFLLLDKLVNYSQEFLVILSENKKE